VGYLHVREGGRWIVLAAILGIGIGLAAGVLQKGLDLARELAFRRLEAALDTAVAGANHGRAILHCDPGPGTEWNKRDFVSCQASSHSLRLSRSWLLLVADREG
jgi:hypothetical protein